MGAINMGADVKPGLIERSIGLWARDQSVGKRAPRGKGLYNGDLAAIATGLDHYRENCVMCHGAPGVAAADLSKGINPSTPLLDEEENHRSDGELFRVVKHGIRMTAMPAFGPTHTDEEIWKIVACMRHLPDLTALEGNSLRAATGEEAPLHHEVETNVPPVK